MGKKKQRYTSFHLHLSNQLKHLPRKLAHLRSEPPAAQVMEGVIFDSFRSLGLSNCNLNNDQMLDAPAQYNNTPVMVPLSDRFFVSPSMSGSLAVWDCNCNAPLQEEEEEEEEGEEEEEELTVPPSYHRFFVSPSSSGLISSTLDHPVIKFSEVVAVSPSTSGTILEEEEEEEEVTVPPSYHRFFVSPSTSGLITLDQRVKSSQVVAVSPFTSSSNKISSDHESVLASSSSALELDGTSSSSSDSPPAPLINIPGDGIAVSTDSDDPYQDFRQSMQEMLHHYAKTHQFQPLDYWYLLEELLFCYLELNDWSMHCYIIKAFADVVVAACSPASLQPIGSIH